MVRLAIPPLLLMVCSLAAHSAEPAQASPQPTLNIGNGEEPTDPQLLVIAKMFCVDMRRHHASGTRAFRSTFGNSYFDPCYLKKHGLKSGDLRVQMAPVNNIFNMVVADDRRTVVCYVDTDSGQQEVILLRTIVRGGKLALQPLKAPDSKTGTVTPWILRMPLKSTIRTDP